MIAPNGKGIILVGKYCSEEGDGCSEKTEKGEEFLPVFVDNLPPDQYWNNENNFGVDVEREIMPFGSSPGNMENTENKDLLIIPGTNTKVELVASLAELSVQEDLSNSLIGDWYIFSKKQKV